MADITQRQLMRVLRSELDKGPKLYLLALLACADENGEGEPGQDRLGELCSAAPDALAAYKREVGSLERPVLASPVLIRWSRDAIFRMGREQPTSLR
jgi:hypothetical protein